MSKRKEQLLLQRCTDIFLHRDGRDSDKKENVIFKSISTVSWKINRTCCNTFMSKHTYDSRV